MEMMKTLTERGKCPSQVECGIVVKAADIPCSVSAGCIALAFGLLVR